MPSFMDMDSHTPLGQYERVIRNNVGRSGEIWVWANAARLRRLQRLGARFSEKPIAGGDMAFFGPPPMPPHSGARPGQTVPDAGGLLVLSAHPFPEPSWVEAD